jgi:ketosteroid isomerase-like protein
MALLKLLVPAAFVIGLSNASAILSPAAAQSLELPDGWASAGNSSLTPEQRGVYEVVHKYEQYLNAGNAEAIVDLFADKSVVQGNEVRTLATRDQKIKAYTAIFKTHKFSTVFGYDAIDIDGNTAFVRTHHHVGATYLQDGKPVIDLNREVFVLRKQADGWKIVLYTYNTDPVQGEG